MLIKKKIIKEINKEIKNRKEEMWACIMLNGGVMLKFLGPIVLNPNQCWILCDVDLDVHHGPSLLSVHLAE